MERKNYIDYSKALCIMLVVFIHTGFSVLSRILPFSLPIFFAATGYTFSFGKRSFGQNFVLRFKSIMLPFFTLMLVYTAIEMLRANLFGYGTAAVVFPALVNTVYGSGIIPFGGIFEILKEILSYKAQPEIGADIILPTNCHLWFLPAMFVAYVMFSALVKFARKNHWAKVLSIFCLVLFASIEAVFPKLCQMPYGLGRGAIGAAFMLWGFWLKDYKLLEDRSKRYYILTNIIALAVFIPSYYFASKGCALVRSYYGPYGVFSVFTTFIWGAAGIWLVLSLCKAIDALPLERLKKLLSYIGKNIMTVYAWHMAVKFLFDAVYICLVKSSDFSMLDEYKMGLMPESSMYFMLFEATAVIAMCLLCGEIKHKFDKKVKSSP